jgi:branched-chain amino acid aminotransferase
VITPVASLKWKGGEIQVADGNGGPVTGAVRSALLDLQYGRTKDLHNWMTKIC